jgi:hypothetical protein
MLIVIEKDPIKLHRASRGILMKLIHMQSLDGAVMIECPNILTKTYLLLDLIIKEHHWCYLQDGFRLQS